MVMDVMRLTTFQGLEKRVICLLDGDGTIFSADLMNQGQEGGLEAARMLTEKIRQHLSYDRACEQFQLWVYLFYNKRGLLETFGRVGLSAARQKFEDFIMGFNQAAERFVMVDVGGSKEAADAKIKGPFATSIGYDPLPHTAPIFTAVHVEDNIRLPQTYKIIFGGNHPAFFFPPEPTELFARIPRQWIRQCSSFCHHSRFP
jgi:hypothetical protein